MAKRYLKNIQDIPILFESSPRAKNINITIRHDTTVRVSVPLFTSFIEAENIAGNKLPWIKSKLIKIQSQMAELKNKVKDLEPIDEAKAKVYLRDRLAELAEIYRLKYNKVFIRNQKTRWGSCSSKDNISLNMKLLHLPENLIDYILLHELVHTRVKNHSKDFWNELETVVPNARTIDKQLREYQYCLF